MKSINHLLMLLLVIGLVSCHVEDDIAMTSINLTSSSSSSMKLGKKLENPYSVENMKRAWDSLQSSNGGIVEDIEIETTHYYVKFTPLDESEFDVLKSDASVLLYDYPLDYEIDVQGDYYHDPNVPASQPTPQYCAVKVDYQFPKEVEYEILEELFIPDDYSDNLKGRIADEWIVESLVNESLRLTNNLPDVAENDHTVDVEIDGSDQGRITNSGSSWRPAGRVMVWDDQIGSTPTSRMVFDYWYYYDCGGDDPTPIANLGDDKFDLAVPTPTLIIPTPTDDCRVAIYKREYFDIKGSYVPVVDLEVRATRWFTTRIGLTGTDGRYSADGTFNGDANYSIKWEKYHFSIRAGNFGQAQLDGPQQCGDWNPKIGRQGATEVDDPQQYYALIFQGARDYYYGNRFGLGSPPRNAALKPQMKIAAKLESKKSHAAVYIRYGIIGGTALGTVLNQLPGCYVRRYNQTSDRVYGITAHELAHWSHWLLDKSAFVNLATDAYVGNNANNEAVIESWANGVEWQFGIGRYRDQYSNSKYKYDNNYQTKKIAPFDEDPNDLLYTSIVADMIDNCNQRTNACHFFPYPDRADPFNTEYPRDRVNGYTIQEVENGVRGARSWNEWRNNMRGINNSTSGNINELFANWY